MAVQPDEVTIQGTLTGTGSPVPPMNASYGVKEGFLEARLPLVQDKPLVKEISIDTAYRYSKYDVGYSTDTYKFGVDYSPTSSFRLRAGYNRAVRVPNIAELFAADVVALDGSADPCASSSGSPAAATTAQCKRSGLTPAQYGKIGTPGNPAGQYNGLVGGNPKLKPEIADTYTFGIVATPRFAAQLHRDARLLQHQDQGPDQQLRRESDRQSMRARRQSAVLLDGESRLRGLALVLEVRVRRRSAAQSRDSRRPRERTPRVNYTQSVGPFGSLNFNLIGTYTASLDIEPYPGSGDYNCAGYFGSTCGNPLPKWKHTLTIGWVTPWHGLGLEARWRHFGDTENEAANPSPLLAGKINPAIQYTGSRDYLDLIGSDQIFGGVLLQVGVNNVLDKDAPDSADHQLSAAVLQRQYLSTGIRHAGSVHFREPQDRLLSATGTRATPAAGHRARCFLYTSMRSESAPPPRRLRSRLAHPCRRSSVT